MGAVEASPSPATFIHMSETELGPAPRTGADLDRLIAEGRVSRPLRSGLPEPLEPTGDSRALSRALDEIRGDR
jgi:hypothetical protein